ncbi:MAG: zinc metallopeptidase [Lentisphaerae bacterium]|nr:zinc metallopeptidase [Lentisphaerota bacterium]
MFYFDPLYLVFMLPGLLLAGLASLFTRSTFSKYSQVAASSYVTGAEAARRLLHQAGIYDVKIEPVDGMLTDHYDPSSRTLRLSSEVYGRNSLSAIGVACHEAGHAIQHATGYAPLAMRSALVPAANLGSSGSYILLLLGFLLNSAPLMLLGIILFSLSVLFTLVTLPVEYNASSRAKQLMVSAGIVSPGEAAAAGSVLNAAFMTYVASAVSALLMLLYYLVRSGLLGGRRD